MAMVHVWRATLDVDGADLSRCEELLSSDERVRAARFVAPCARRRFIVARAVLRRVLAFYTGCRPHELRFTYAAYGKPRLANGGPAFNLSHAGEIACVAISEREVGVDIEPIRDLPDLIAVATIALGKESASLLASLMPEDRLASFYRRWTRMEALLKGLGEGLGGVAHSEGIAPAVSAAWTVRAFRVAPGYAAAVAVNGAVRRIIVRDAGPLTERSGPDR